MIQQLNSVDQYCCLFHKKHQVTTEFSDSQSAKVPCVAAGWPRPSLLAPRPSCASFWAVGRGPGCPLAWAWKACYLRRQAACSYLMGTFCARCGCWRFSMVGIRDAGYVQEMLTAARLASRKACCAQHQLDSMQPCSPAGESGWTAGPQAISRRTQERAKSCYSCTRSSRLR
jgi:hypothetical protein